MPEAVIQDGVTLSDNERAVIEKYGFELSFVTGSETELRLVDPVLRDSGNPDESSNCGEDLESLLQNAVRLRVAYDKENGKPAKAAKAPKAAKVATPKTPKAAKAEKPEPVAKDDKGEIKGAKLDNTGDKPARTKKVKVAKVRKDNRYLRATRLIIANPGITEKQLANAIGGSAATAGYCLEAWHSIVAAMREAGKDVAMPLVFPKAAPKTAPKADDQPVADAA